MASVSQIRRMMQMETPHQETVTGDVASFVTDFPAPAKVTAEFSPVQSGTGDPSPDNVRPISGWTDAEVTRTGNNLVDALNDPEHPDKGWISSGSGSAAVQYDTSNDGYYTITARRLIFNFLKSGTYTVSFFAKKRGERSANATRSGINGVETNKFPTHWSGYTGSYDRYAVTYNVSAGDYFFLTLYAGIFIRDIQIEKNSSAASYKPYRGTTIPITFPDSAGTVYGGNIQLNEDGSGVLVADRAIKTYNGSETWTRTAATGGYQFYTGGISPLQSSPLAICDRYITTTSTDVLYARDNHILLISWRVAVHDNRYTEVEDFKAYLAEQYNNGTPLTVCYILSNPTTYPLSADQLRTLLGVNNVWTSLNGSVTVRLFKHE